MIVFIMALSVLSGFGQETEGEQRFDDVPETHYAYNYINLMADLGIINGYGDGNFGPYDSVSKAEFAKMMVLTLQLQQNTPEVATFLDVDAGDWEYPYVETAKYYMTFWNTGAGYYFRPTEDAVREDMAVAIVKGLGIDVANVDLSVLDDYSDAHLISPSLRKYVAAAINEGIMVGNGSGLFMPQEDVFRGDAATMLARLIEEEKVTFEEEKMTFEEDMGDAPFLSAEAEGDHVRLNWTPGNTDGLEGYKVVFSTTDSTPMYPDQGYVTYTDSTSYDVYEGMDWYGGEEDSLESDVEYYVAITALYSDGTKLSSNTEVVTLPDAVSGADETSHMDYEIRNNKVILTWDEAKAPLQYYKVVMSAYEDEPMYPDDGYLFVLTDEYAEIEAGDSYHGGTVGTVEAGKTYYVAITVVFKDGSKISTNVEEITIPDNGHTSVEKTAPTLYTVTRSDDVLLQWTDVEGDINYYKVVLSKNDATPSYPENGWLVYQDETYYEVESGESYSGGDVGTVRSGQTYYVAITVVYTDGTKLTSNVERITIP